jgi:protein-S-isoprenylcysteine O-methyltransferase Ste14
VAVAHDFTSSGTRRFVAGSGGVAFTIAVLYGAWSYAGRFGAPAEAAASPWPAAAANIALFIVFGLHHSLFARTGVKARLAAFVPAELERTTYVWVASILFVVMVGIWQPVPGTLWQIETPAAWLIRATQLAGAVLLLSAGRHIDVAAMAGIREPQSERRSEESALADRGPYGLVRHPLYLAILLLLWAVPVMTNTRLLFAVLNTAYVLVAIPFEERDLRRSFGAAYERYATRVRSRVLPGIY